MPDELLYVYGVVPRAERRALPADAGVAGSTVETVEHDGLAALTSRIPRDELRAVRELRAHWRVLQRVCESATVVPMRFGTVLESEQAVRERLLDANAAHLDELLRQLSGCVQMTVKGSYDEQRILHEVVVSSPQLSALAARVRSVPGDAAYFDRIKLGEGVAAAVDDRRLRDEQRAFEALEPAAVAARTEQVTAAFDAFNFAFLVRRTRQRNFSHLVRDLIEEFGERVAVQYVAPLPPYSFADGELAAGVA